MIRDAPKVARMPIGQRISASLHVITHLDGRRRESLIVVFRFGVEKGDVKARCRRRWAVACSPIPVPALWLLRAEDVWGGIRGEGQGGRVVRRRERLNHGAILRGCPQPSDYGLGVTVL